MAHISPHVWNLLVKFIKITPKADMCQSEYMLRHKNAVATYCYIRTKIQPMHISTLQRILTFSVRLTFLQCNFSSVVIVFSSGHNDSGYKWARTEMVSQTAEDMTAYNNTVEN